MATLEQVRDFFKGDRYATDATGLVIEKAEKGHAVVSLMPGDIHKNAVGGLRGAVYYTMADFAFAVAENCGLDPDSLTVTQSSEISFLKGYRGGKVLCSADIIKDGKSICVYEVKMTAEDGTLLAIAITNGFKTSK